MLLFCQMAINLTIPQKGGTPLMVASINGHVNIVKLLIEAKALLNIQEKEVLLYSARKGISNFLSISHEPGH